MEKTEKRPVAELPAPSTSLTSDPLLTHPGSEAELRFEFGPREVHIRAGICFEKVRAYRFRAEGHCAAWHVQGAYDTLVEVIPSEWVAELLAADRVRRGGKWQIRHFLLFVDGAGAYEVAAASWSWLQEDPAE